MLAMAPPEAQAEVWRFNFWQAAEAVVPDLWPSLHAEVTPAFLLACQNPPLDVYQWHWREYLQGCVSLHAVSQEDWMPEAGKNLSAALLGWQRRWRLMPEWCELYALQQLHLWNELPELAGTGGISYGWGGTIPQLPPPTLPQWDVWTSWDSYRTRVEGLLNAYRDRAVADLKAQGWTVQKHGRGDTPEKHLRWLALVVLKGLTVSQIDAAEGSVQSAHDKTAAIAKGIRRASKRVGISVPSGTYG